MNVRRARHVVVAASVRAARHVSDEGTYMALGP